MVPLESPTAQRRGWTLDRRGLPDDPDLQHGGGSLKKSIVLLILEGVKNGGGVCDV